jgi:phage-related protein
MKIFYLNNRISNFIDQLDSDSIRVLTKGFDMLRARGQDLRMPHSKSIGNGLFELRLWSNPPIRAIFGFRNDNVLVVHIFFKKTMRIPKHEIDYAVGLWKSIVA